LAQCLEVAQREAEMILDTMPGAISRAVKRGERVEVRRFGVFQSSRRSGWKVRNPRTGAIADIGPKRTAVFRASRPLLKVLNGGEGSQRRVTKPFTHIPP
jgi:nucleoid DNA-binding protein